MVEADAFCLYGLNFCVAITVNGKTVTPSSSESLAAIDTGTTLIAGPSDAVANIWSQVEGSQALSGQMAGFFSYRMFTLHPSPFSRARFSL